MQELVMDKKKILQGICGDSPITKVMDFFIHHREEEFTITQIAKGAKIARTTLWAGVLEDALNRGLLKKTKEVGNAKLFALNKESKMTKILLDFYERLVRGE